MVAWVSMRRECRALILCWLMIGHGFVECARLRVRHAHGHSAGRSTRSSDALGALQSVSANERMDISEHILYAKPIAHLKKRFMNRLEKMDVDQVVARLGEKLPPEVAVLATSTKRDDQPYTEESLAKARRILNGMVEEAQGRLDRKQIACKVFYDRNRGAWGQATSDLARLGEEISNLVALIDESTSGIQSTTDNLEAVEEKRTQTTQAYEKVKAADEVEMTAFKDDLAVAEFILEFTVCKDKQWKKKVLFQSKKDASPTNFNVVMCPADEGDFEFHFEDPKLQAQANKFLTPGARAKLQKYLGITHTQAIKANVLLQTGNDFGYSSPAFAEREDDRDEDDDEDDDDKSLVDAEDSKSRADSILDKLSQNVQAVVSEKEPTAVIVDAHKTDSDNKEDDETSDHPDVLDSSSADREDVKKSTNAALVKKSSRANIASTAATAANTQTLAAPIAGATPRQSRKCSLGKPNCGLLHDNMSMMWGDFKDAVDKKKAEMDKKKQEYDELIAELNQETEVLVSSKTSFEEKLSEATGHKLGAVSEQAERDNVRLLLEKEFAEKWGECKATMYEILYTDICGVLKVRGEVAKFSKKVPPNKIVDCDFGEFEPTPCSVTCDNTCDPHGSTPKCGGTQVLRREIIAQKNDFGHKCPKLVYTRPCGQILCPVNCQMSRWSGWSKCTKECEGGTQLRNRGTINKAANGGDGCDSVSESRSCNVGSCDRDCKLKPWTKWSPCSQACDSGFQERFRHIKVPTRGNGKCPAEKNPYYRFQSRKCNTQPCVGDEVCIAKMDLIVAIDGSGSLRDSGYSVLKDFAAKFVRRIKGEAYGYEAARIGVVQFGNGKIEPGRTITPGKQISKMVNDPEDVAKKIEGTVWEKGFTNMAQAFVTAEKIMMNSGRKEVPSTVMIISDGKPTFKFETMNVVREAKNKGVKVIVVTVNDKLGKEDRKFMQAVASHPWKTNYVKIPGIKKLKASMDKYVIETLVQACPKAESPSSFEDIAEDQGFELFKDGLWCGEGPKFHELIGEFLSVEDCFSAAKEQGAKYFFYETSEGPEGEHKNGCYIEKADDPEKCPEGFVEAPGQLYWISHAADFSDTSL